MADSCAHCKKTKAELSNPLKQCAKCKSITYCSRDCQKADWKKHKKVCDRGAHASTSSAGPSASPINAGPFQIHSFNDPTIVHNAMSGNVLVGLSQEEAYKCIIDSYRLRVEDEYQYESENRGIYAGEDPMADFRDFLDKAESKRVLPEWWDKDKRAECEKLGAIKGGWSDLSCAIEKVDVQKEYNDNLMPMKIRVLAERIYGRRIMA